MKIKTNYHTHNHFCDGKGDPEEYVQFALKRGFSALGFSSHAPIPYENDWTLTDETLAKYITRVNELKDEYKDRLQIYLGLEIDYLENISGPSSQKFQDLNLDYNIGSVHMMMDEEKGLPLAIDGPDEEFVALYEDVFKKDIKQMVKTFYRLVRQMVDEHNPDFIGHFDLIKKKNRNNRYFNEEERWYKTEIFDTLDFIAQKDAVLEVNTGGLSRGATDTVYPAPWMLHGCKERNIRIMLNADAHAPEHLDFYYEEAEEIIKKTGYKELVVLLDGKWQTKEI